MKISRIPNLGSFGVYIDDVDMNHITNDEWLEIGRIFVKELVVVLRNTNISKEQYYDEIPKFGPIYNISGSYFYKKYGHNKFTRDPATWEPLDATDRLFMETRYIRQEDIGNNKYLSRITGERDENGQSLGYFDSGDLFWHSNESSSLTFAPCVSLLGWEAMGGSSTGFTQTVDVYENLPESLRKELDEMILIHDYVPGVVNAGEITDPIMAKHALMNSSPFPGMETPLVCTAPNGRKGLHYSIHSRSQIRDMKKEESDDLFDRLDKLIFAESNIYDHWYDETRRDLLLFDNSVTLHRRIGHQEGRLAYRIQFTPSEVVEKPWMPWQHMPACDTQYRVEMKTLIDLTGGDLKARYQLPELV
jgi:alpha-ketoglutarate-dependent taurine dioxygenase